MSEKQPTDHGTGQKKPGSVADNQPPNPDGTAKATRDNNLTTGHSDPDDGGDDNATPQDKR